MWNPIVAGFNKRDVIAPPGAGEEQYEFGTIRFAWPFT